MDSKVILADFIQKYLSYTQFNYEKFTILSIPKYVLIFSYFHIVTIGLWGHLFHYIFTLDGDDFLFTEVGTDVAGILSSYFAVYFEVAYLIYSKDIRAVLYQLGNFEEHEMPEDFREKTEELEIRTKRSVTTFFMSQFVVWGLTLLQTCEDGVVDDCGLTINGYMPFDIFYTPMRQIFSFLQCTSGFLSGTACLSIALVFLFMFQSLTLMAKHLQVMLLEIPKLDNRSERKKLIKKCVLYHYRILDLMGECSNHTERILFLLVSLASIIISLTSYQLIVVRVEYTTVVHLSGYLFSSMAICIYGERLIIEGQNLFLTLYDSVPWDEDVATSRDLYIMMLMARSGLFLPAGKFGPIGHIRAMLILKGSYSFLTLFLNV